MDGDNDVLMGEPEVVQNQRKAATGIGVTGDDFSADEVTGSADASVPVGVADQRSCRPGNDDRGSGFEPISDRMEDERERSETVPSASWNVSANVNEALVRPTGSPISSHSMRAALESMP